MIDIIQWRSCIGVFNACRGVPSPSRGGRHTTDGTVSTCEDINPVHALLCHCIIDGVCSPHHIILPIITIVSLLLILSGDIETNPGPCNIRVGAIVDALTDLVYWETFATHLPMVTSADIQKIAKDHKSTDTQKFHLFSLWLNRYPDASWSDIVRALKKVGENTLAVNIEQTQDQTTKIVPPSVSSQTGCHLQKSISDPLPLVAKNVDQPRLYHSASDPTDYHQNNHSNTVESTFDNDIRLYKDYLTGLYKRQTPAYSKKPSPPIGKYIQLLLLPNGKNNVELSMKRKREGDTKMLMEDHNLRVPISIKDVCANVNSDGFPFSVLIQGDPGVGKTTLAWELCKEWAENKILNEWTIVKIVQLRDQLSRDAKNLESLIDPYGDLPGGSGVIKYIREKNGAGLLLIFDGFDELSDAQREPSSVFMRLLSGNSFSRVSIIVTTRPLALESIPEIFMNNLHQHLQIIGFTKKFINEYIETKFKKNPEILKAFTDYISSHHFVFTFMYVPLHCALVTELYKTYWNEKRKFAPKTLTQLYTYFIHGLIERSTGYKIQEKIDELPANLKEEYNELAKTAADGIKIKKYVFDDRTRADSFGMLQAPMDSRNSKSYSFLHLTLQEYLAAYYWSIQPTAAIDDLFKGRGALSIDYSGEKRKPAVESHLPALHFYSGLTGIAKTPLADHVSHYRKQLPSVYEFFCLLFESQNSRIAALSVFNEGLEKVKIESFKEAYVTGYCIARANESVRWEIEMTESTFIESMAHGIEHAKLPEDGPSDSMSRVSSIQKLVILSGKRGCDIHQFLHSVHQQVSKYVKDLKMTYNSELVTFKSMKQTMPNLDLLHFQYNCQRTFNGARRGIPFTKALLNILTPLTTLRMVSLVGGFSRLVSDIKVITTSENGDNEQGNVCVMLAETDKPFIFTPLLLPENCPPNGLVPYLVIQHLNKHVGFGLMEHGYNIFLCARECCNFPNLRSLFEPFYSSGVFHNNSNQIQCVKNNVHSIKVILLGSEYEFLFKEHFHVYFYNAESREWKSIKFKENPKDECVMILVNQGNAQFLAEHILNFPNIEISNMISIQVEHLQKIVLPVVTAMKPPIKSERPFQFSILLEEDPYCLETLHIKGYIDIYTINVMEWKVSRCDLDNLLDTTKGGSLPFEIISFSIGCYESYKSKLKKSPDELINKLMSISQSTLREFTIGMYWGQLVDEMAEAISTKLQECTGLAVVEFNHVSSSDCLVKLYKGLVDHTSLKTLIIVGCRDSFDELMEVVHSVKPLTNVVIHNCKFTKYKYETLVLGVTRRKNRSVYICEKQELLTELFDIFKEQQSNDYYIMLADSKKTSSWAMSGLHSNNKSVEKASFQEFQNAMSSLKINPHV